MRRPKAQGTSLLAGGSVSLNMVERGTLQEEYVYEIEFDDGTDYSHYYYTNKIDTENPSLLRFDPLYELGQDIDHSLSRQTLMLPYIRVVKIIKRKEAE